MFKSKLLWLALVAVTLSWLYGCRVQNQATAHPSQLNFSEFPLKKLSDYGFYKGELKQLTPNDHVLEYEPVATLFTDYAFKKRFVWMPEGTSATFDVNQPNEPLDFPDKTILVKNFYYPHDFSKPTGERRILETRLLVKDQGTWKAYPYRWNDAQTDADYKITGETIPVSWKDEAGQAHQINYAIPNKNQCKSCHNRKDVFMPIGPKIKQLNHELAYQDGKENQLTRWQKVGYLKANAEDIAKVVPLVSMNDAKASLGERARSYLDVNCGHCHHANGPASTSGLYLNVEEKDPFHWGVMKSPVAAGMGAGPYRFDINPGKGKESILTYRMNSTHPGVMMPEIGRVSIHKEGVALIEQWIDGLEKGK